jgi:hypothetical protein
MTGGEKVSRAATISAESPEGVCLRCGSRDTYPYRAMS